MIKFERITELYSMLYLVKQTLKVLELLESVLHILTPELSYIITDALLLIDMKIIFII